MGSYFKRHIFSDMLVPSTNLQIYVWLLPAVVYRQHIAAII